MSVWMLAAAAVSVVGLLVLVWGVRMIARTAAELQTELRRSSATSVASDELMRAAVAVGDHAERTRADAEEIRSGLKLVYRAYIRQDRRR